MKISLWVPSHWLHRIANSLNLSFSLSQLAKSTLLLLYVFTVTFIFYECLVDALLLKIIVEIHYTVGKPRIVWKPTLYFVNIRVPKHYRCADNVSCQFMYPCFTLWNSWNHNEESYKLWLSAILSCINLCQMINSAKKFKTLIWL